MDALALVVNSDSPALKAMIVRFQQAETSIASQDGSASSPSKSQQGRAALGHAAPCANYADLVTIAEIDTMTAEFNDAESANDIKGTNEKIKKAKEPIKALVNTLGQATRDIAMHSRRCWIQAPRRRTR